MSINDDIRENTIPDMKNSQKDKKIVVENKK